MLRHIGELEPLFNRFGAVTMSEVPRREIKGIKRRPAVVAPRPRRKIASHLRKATRTYVFHETENINVSDYRLPVLTIHEGVVVLDGEAQHRALIESDDRTTRWTRPSPSHGYEHGHVNMYNHGLAGSGVVILSDDPDLKDMPQGESLKCVRFTIAKPNINVATPSSSLLHEKNLAPPATLHRSKRGGQTRELALPEPMSLVVPGITDLAPLLSTAVPTLDPDYHDAEDEWDLILDADVWAKGQVKTSASKPVSFGKIVFETYHSGGKTGMPIPIVIIPVLDDLCKAINARHLNDKKAPSWR